MMRQTGLEENIEHVAFPFPKLNPLYFIPGIWVNGKCYWLHNVREKVLFEEELTVKVTLEKIHSKIDYSHLFISNHSREKKDVKILVAHYHPKVSEKQLSFASPSDRVAFHLVNQDVYMVNGQCDGKSAKEYTIQPYWNLISNQIWTCENQGSLKYQPMAKGPSASILALDASIPAHGTSKANTWVINGKNRQEVVQLDQALLKKIR